MTALLARGWTAVRTFLAEQTELQERLGLLNRPWEEDFVHWAGDGPHRELHGHLPPPPDGRRRSVTRSGWCPGLRARVQGHASTAPTGRGSPTERRSSP